MRRRAPPPAARDAGVGSEANPGAAAGDGGVRASGVRHQAPGWSAEGAADSEAVTADSEAVTADSEAVTADSEAVTADSEAVIAEP
jgi:hypothetical protein